MSILNCPTCGGDLDVRARSCADCGAPILDRGRPGDRQARRLVTVTCAAVLAVLLYVFYLELRSLLP